MARAPFQHVTPGQPQSIRAREYNAFIDLARKRSLGTDRWIINPAGPQQLVRVLNQTEEIVPAFGVLAYGEPLIRPITQEQESSQDSTATGTFKRNFAFEGKLPATELAGRILITLETIPPGRHGLAAIDGVVPCRIRMDNPTAKAADLLAGDVTQLVTSPSGSARILWVQGNTGTQWALVRLGDPRGSQAVAILAEATERVWVGEVGDFRVLTGPLLDPAPYSPEIIVPAVVWEHPVFPNTRCLLSFIDLAADVSEVLAAAGGGELLLQNGSFLLNQDGSALLTQPGASALSAASLHVAWSEYGKTIFAAANGTIPAGGQGQAFLFLHDVATTDLVPVHLKYLHQGQDISGGRQIIASWQGDVRRYDIIGAECENPGAGGIPSTETSTSGDFNTLTVAAEWLVDSSTAPHNNAPGGQASGRWWLSVMSDADTGLLIRQNASGQHDASLWQRFSQDGGQTWTSWTLMS